MGLENVFGTIVLFHASGGYELERVFGRIVCVLVAIPFVLLLLRAAWFHASGGDERAHRKREGLCVRCGYDIRATPDRCPECGTRVAAPGDVLLRDMLSRQSGVPVRRITGESRLAEDLGMSGDDAAEFMADFFKAFDVDAREFVFTRYFLGEYVSFSELVEPPRSPISVDHLLACIRQRKWSDPVVCPSCGYDLRATPDRCPECGAVPPPPPPPPPSA